MSQFPVTSEAAEVSAAPRAEHRCPLCGEPNGCVPAATGTFGGGPCWCREVVFSGEVLARVPEAARGRACLCRRCATTTTGTASTTGDTGHTGHTGHTGNTGNTGNTGTDVDVDVGDGPAR
ncbi:MAG: cysteine-rich CWC family protein [Rubrivivax sp.]|nr:cysteine-rich CWC family protein [Rubrivivax sp.]